MTTVAYRLRKNTWHAEAKASPSRRRRERTADDAEQQDVGRIEPPPQTRPRANPAMPPAMG